jgi:hypothetical protein
MVNGKWKASSLTEIGVLLFSTIVAAVHFGTLYAAARKQQG